MNIERLQHNNDLVRRFYAAVPQIDDDLSYFFTDDFFITEADDLPYGGEYRGKLAMRELVTRINEMITVADVQIHRLAVSEDSVIATLSFDLDVGNGMHERQYVAEEFLLTGDLIREVRPYYFNNALMHRNLTAQA